MIDIAIDHYAATVPPNKQCGICSMLKKFFLKVNNETSNNIFFTGQKKKGIYLFQVYLVWLYVIFKQNRRKALHFLFNLLPKGKPR